MCFQWSLNQFVYSSIPDTSELLNKMLVTSDSLYFSVDNKKLACVTNVDGKHESQQCCCRCLQYWIAMLFCDIRGKNSSKHQFRILTIFFTIFNCSNGKKNKVLSTRNTCNAVQLSETNKCQFVSSVQTLQFFWISSSYRCEKQRKFKVTNVLHYELVFVPFQAQRKFFLCFLFGKKRTNTFSQFNQIEMISYMQSGNSVISIRNVNWIFEIFKFLRQFCFFAHQRIDRIRKKSQMKLKFIGKSENSIVL